MTDRRAERAAARRRHDRRGQTIAAVSTVIVLGGLAALILTSPGWPEVRDTFFDPEVFRESFPDIARAFWLDIRVFLIVEVAVLVLGLVVALVRTVDAPALFPVRLLATVYTDVFRGIPTILLVYLVGFGIPALDLSGLPTEPVVLGGIALTLSYGAYVAEVYRAGLNSVHPGQRDAALAIGLTERQATRHVILPQAVRRVGPPLLNDFIALQKDVALIAIIGVTGEAFREAQILTAANFNYTPLIAAAMLYLAITIPMARLLDRWERGRARSVNAADAVLEFAGVTKSFGELQVLDGIDLEVAEHEAVAVIGASGSGKSTLLRCVDLLEEIDDGDILLDGEVITDPSVDPVSVRRRLGFIFQAYNLFPHLSVLENVVLGATKAHGVAVAEAEAAARAQLERLGLGGREARQPRAALRRPAAAGGDRARVRRPAARDAARRDHQRARPGAGRRGAGGGSGAEERGGDDADRDSRDGLCPRGRRSGLLPASGAPDRGRPARAGARVTPRARDPALPAPPARGRSGLDGQADEAGAGVAGAAMLASSASSARNVATSSESSPLASIIATDSR